MCVMSMVYDHYDKVIPTIEITPAWTWTGTTTAPQPDLAKIIEDFKAAREAAAIVDEKTGQTDCVDPEKQKLEQRVAELEKLLAEAAPDTYRVIDGKLYRTV